MSWFGKLIGGTLGFFFMGGPLGAIFGAAVGQYFDTLDEENKGKTPDQYSDNEKRQAAFFVATFTLLGKIVHADGKMMKSEVDAFYKLLNTQFRMGTKETEFAYSLFSKASVSEFHYSDLLNQFYTLFASEKEMLLLQLDLMARLAIADGHFDNREKTMLEEAKTAFKISDFDYEEILKRYTLDSKDKYYAVLGCKPQDDNDTIKAKYRKLAIEYHPDKVIAKGLPEEFILYAKQKFQEIQNAYEEIKKERNMV